MVAGGDTVPCAELELRSSRLAHFLRASGLRRLDHYAIFIENNACDLVFTARHRITETCSVGRASWTSLH